MPRKARNVLPGLLKSVMTSAISTSAAFAIVAFASVGVAAVAMVAHSEIAGTAYQPAIKSAYTAQTHQPNVLGAVSYGYNQPKCTKAGACLNYQWINFNNDGWQAKIDYQLPAKYQSGYIRVNGWKFMDGISGSGSGYTGYDLEPGQKYTFTLYGRYGRLNYKLTSMVLTGPDAPTQQCPVQGAPAPTNCYYDYSSDPCGQLVCNPIDPVYGYSAVSVPQPDRGWREGWIEQVYYGTDRAPGSMKILGWVYDNGNSLSWNGLQLAMKNETTGASYNPVDMSIQTTERSDIRNYINQKLGITVGNASNIYIFIAKFDNLPTGTYSVYNARYNGYLFNNAHHGPYYISQPQPVYGYAGTLFFKEDHASSPTSVTAGAAGVNFLKLYANNNGAGRIALQSLSFEADSVSVLQNLTNFVVRDDSGNLVSNVVYPTAGNAGIYMNFGSPVIIETNSTKALTLIGDVPATASGNIKFHLISLAYGPNSNYPNNVQYGDWGNTISIVLSQAAAPRVGQIINNNGTVFYVGEGKIYGFPDLATFNSWGFSFSQLVIANDAEKALPNGGVVPMKDPRYSTPLEQIKAQQNPAVLALSSYVFPVTQVKPGDVDVTVLKLLLTSDVSDAPVDTVSIQQDPGYAALTNFRIYNDAGVVLGSLDKLPYVATANRNFGGIPLTNTLVIPRGTSKALIVKANIPLDAQGKTKVKAIGLSTNSTQSVSYRLADNLDGPEIAIGNSAPVANNPAVKITSLTVDGSYVAGNSVLPVMWKVTGPSTMTLTGTTVIQLSSISGNVRQEAARITASSILNQDNFATFSVPANINPGSYKVVVNVTYSDPNYGYNLPLNAESVGVVNVTASATSGGGSTIPKITFTANSQPSDLIVNVGDPINYQWAAVGASSLTSAYTANIADTCAGGSNAGCFNRRP